MSEFRFQGKPVLWSWPYIASKGEQDHCYKLTEQQASLALRSLYVQAQWRTRWLDVNNFDDVQNLVANTIYRLENPTKCGKTRPRRVFPFDFYFGESGDLIIEIYEDCEMPVTVNIYENCCGDNSGESQVIDSNNISQNDLAISKQATKCDYVTNVVPYFISRLADWFGDVDIAITNGATLIDAVLGTIAEFFDPRDLTPNGIEVLTEYLSLSLDAFVAAFNDPDLVLRTQENWWGRVPPGTRYSAVTRSDLVDLGRSLPTLWGNALITGTVSPRAVGELIARVMSIEEFNAQMLISRNRANYALCEYLAARNGEVYEPPTSPLPPIGAVTTIDVSSGGEVFKIYRVAELTLQDVTNVASGVEITSSEQCVGCAFVFPPNQPIREGVNENTVIRNADGNNIQGFADASENLNANGATDFRYNSAVVSASQAADLIAEMIEVTVAALGSTVSSGETIGEILIRHETGSPFPPAAASTVNVTYIAMKVIP